MNVRARLRSMFLLAPAVLAAACMTAGDPNEADMASVDMAVTVVPTGVQCVKVVVTVGSQTITPPLMTVVPGSSSASLSLGLLPAGAATFSGSAFNATCSAVTSATVANWIADPTTTTLSPGAVATVMMTFRQNNGVTVGVGFAPNVAEVSVGAFASYARLVDGTVLQWGNVDVNTQLLAPTPVPNLTNVVQVAGGYLSACARKTDHSVWCWGTNLNGQLGPNIAVGATSQIPAQVTQAAGAAPFVAVAMGQQHTCGLQGTGVACWGNNALGQFGTGNTTSSTTPTGAFGAIGAVSAGGSHTCAIDEVGSLYCTGSNASGQLGLGSTASSVLFFQTPTQLENVVSVSAGGDHTCVLMGDGTVRCFGNNGFGQLGDGTMIGRNAPVTVVGLSNVVQIQAGARHTCALLQNGTVSCWGQAAMLGAGVIADQPTPVTVPGLTGVTAIHTAGTAGHTCAELADHTVKCWGSNHGGQIGNGNTVFANRPTTVLF